MSSPSGRGAECCSVEACRLEQEVEDPALLDFPMATLDVVVTKREAAEQTLSVLAQRHGRGVILDKLIRGGEEIPFVAETIINRGDILRLAGAAAGRGARRTGGGLHRASIQ